MNKEAIENTAVCRWDAEFECFVVESPLFDRVTGAAETVDEAWTLFHELLDETHEAYEEGKLAGYSKPGRPSKGKERLHTKITPDIRQNLDKTAKHLHCSTGEVIEYLWFFYDSLKDVEPGQLAQLLAPKQVPA